jgi:two-component system, NtrC family, sensor kinase
MAEQSEYDPISAQPAAPRLLRTRYVCTVVTAVIGLLAVVGWIGQARVGWPGGKALRTLGFASIPMAPSTGTAFLILGGLIGLLSLPSQRRWNVPVARAAGVLVLLLLTLSTMDRDRWIFPRTGETYDGVPDGVMALPTGLTLLCGTVALLLLTLPAQVRVAGEAAEFLGVIVTALGLIFTLGYLYGGPFFAGDSSLVPPAFNTSVALVFLGVGVVASIGPRAALVRHLTGSAVTARLLRAFLPFTAITVCAVAWLMHAASQQRASSAALVSAVLAVAAIFFVSLVCMRIAASIGADLDRAEHERRDAERQSREYSGELRRLNASLEQRVVQRTEALEASRDHLDQFFTITTSLQDPNNLEKSLDLVLRFCERLGYDRAMISLVDRAEKVIRAVRATGTLAEIVSQTVRPLDGNDILAIVVREGSTIAIPDSLTDDRCEQTARAAAGVRGQIIVPLHSGTDVIGTLQVASRTVLTPTPEQLRTLETLGSQAARAVAGLQRLQEIQRLNRQLEERNARLQQLADELSATAQSERQAHEALRESERRTRSIVDTAYDAFIAMNIGGLIVDWNRQAEVIFGWSRAEVLGRPLEATIIPPRFREAHRQGLQRFRETGEAPMLNARTEIVALHREGHEFPIELTIIALPWEGSVVFTSFLHNITKRKEAQEKLKQTAAELSRKNEQLKDLAANLQTTVESERRAHEAMKTAQSHLVQSEKMAALGQLVAGVAHEINNPLSYVSNNVAVLQRDLRPVRQVLELYQQAGDTVEKEHPDQAQRIREVSQAVDLDYTLTNLEGLMTRSRDGLKRIQQIVKDLRDFARLDESDLHEVDLNAGIQSTVNIVQGNARKERVTVELDLASLPPVTCFPAKINQVVLNLVTNAIDACSPGGRVTVSTRVDGEAVAISVADTGVGIDPAIREKIFDPFFTTKPQGKGTGLGLSISYGIVQAHGGTIGFESKSGEGTRFTVRLPRKSVPSEQAENKMEGV